MNSGRLTCAPLALSVNSQQCPVRSLGRRHDQGLKVHTLPIQTRIPSPCPYGIIIIGYKNKEEHTADMNQDLLERTAVLEGWEYGNQTTAVRRARDEEGWGDARRYPAASPPVRSLRQRVGSFRAAIFPPSWRPLSSRLLVVSEWLQSPG